MEVRDFDLGLRDLQNEYLQFLDDQEDQGLYAEKVKVMILNKSKRLVVNIDDLRRKNLPRAENLLENAFEEQIAFQKALKEYVSNIDQTFAKEVKEFCVAFSGSFGTKHVTPKSLNSRYWGNLVCVEGLVISVSVGTKLVKSLDSSLTPVKVTDRQFTDPSSSGAFATSAVYVTKDYNGDPLETTYDLCQYKDHQTFTLQEMPEVVMVGQMPRCVEVICYDDLVYMCKPGDRVQVVGIYGCLPSYQGSLPAGSQGVATPGTFRTTLTANNVTKIDQETNLIITNGDIEQCKRLAKQTNTDMYEMLSKSLAPSVCGYDYIKKAILCLLLGGMEKILPDGTRLKGNINILLIGEPSVAKSQLLRSVQQIAAHATATTGRGTPGVGLIAAVTTDLETGHRRLEAGAMVLADRGVLCINQFDTMLDIDRVAIREVMEQGEVMIREAGVLTSLNARCSVLAASNCIYGLYDAYKTPMENIGLPNSLLSRFDLLFVMLDIANDDRDTLILERMLGKHRYQKEQEKPDNEEVDESNESIYEKYDPVLHGNTRSKEDRILNTRFIRKYIYLASLLEPELTEEAREVITNEYTRLRKRDTMTQQVTPRTVETLIRLATAHAKCRFSAQISEEDARAAIKLVRFAYFQKVLVKEKRNWHQATYGDEITSSEDATSDDEGSALDDEGSASSDEGSASSDKGSASSDEGSASSDEGSAVDDEGSADDDEGSAVDDEGWAADDEDSAFDDEGSAFDDEGSASDDEGSVPDDALDDEGSVPDNECSALDDEVVSPDRERTKQSQGVMKIANHNKRRAMSSDQLVTSSDEGAASDGVRDKQPRAKKSRVEKGRGEDLSALEEAEVLPAPGTRPSSSQRVIRSARKTDNADRLIQFKSALSRLFREERAISLPLDKVMGYVNQQYPQQTFESDEVLAAIDHMTQDNQVMLADDTLFLI